MNNKFRKRVIREYNRILKEVLLNIWRTKNKKRARNESIFRSIYH